MNLELLEDVQAARVGLPYELGLVGRRGDVLKNVLPDVGRKLIEMGAAREEIKRPSNKAETKPEAPRERKPARPNERK